MVRPVRVRLRSRDPAEYESRSRWVFFYTQDRWSVHSYPALMRRVEGHRLTLRFPDTAQIVSRTCDWPPHPPV